MSWVVDFLARLLDFVLITAFWGGVAVTAMMLIRLAVFVAQRRALRSAARPRPPSASPSWRLTLIVDVDDRARVFRPSVQLRGSTLPFPARIRLELVDERGATRLKCERSLPQSAIGTELALPAFPAPDGAQVQDVLRWHWDVVVQDWTGERARWREHPAPAGPLNAEAELELLGVAPL